MAKWRVLTVTAVIGEHKYYMRCILSDLFVCGSYNFSVQFSLPVKGESATT
jgi:hypothetical protein